MKNFDSVTEFRFQKNDWIFFSNVWCQFYRKLIYKDLSPMFHFRKNYFGTRHKIKMWDCPVFRLVFCACITVRIKIYWYLGACIFFGSEISKFLTSRIPWKYLIIIKVNLSNQKLSTVVLHYHIYLKTIEKKCNNLI